MEVVKMTTASITIVVCVRWEHESRSPLNEPVSIAVIVLDLIIKWSLCLILVKYSF